MKKSSLLNKLFWTYLRWFGVFVIIMVFFFAYFVFYFLKKDVDNTQEQLIGSINENLEGYFNDMNEFSVDLLNSYTFKSIAISELPSSLENGYNLSEPFSRLYRETYKMIQKGYYIGVVVKNQYYIWMGRNYFINRIDGESIHTYDDLVKNEISRVRFLPRNLYLQDSDAGENDKKDSYIVLSRSMSLARKYVNGREILEVFVPEDDFRNDMRKLVGNNQNVRQENRVRVHLYDTDGRLLYGEDDLDFSQFAREMEDEILRANGYLLRKQNIFHNQLTVVYSTDVLQYYKGMMQFWVVAVLISIMILIITIGTIYRISKQISQPMIKICEQMKRMDLKDNQGFQYVESNIQEIDFLMSALEDMNRNLQVSMKEIMDMKDYELQAKMLALQAQMHPHFLYNTLMTIGSMAEDAGQEPINRMCINLTSMFRYISTEEASGITIFEEIRHVGHYVDIMKERFPNSTVDIDIPLEMMDAIIPKLSIQPLVENAFKYCNRQSPAIEISGEYRADDDWIVSVHDNGSGFTDEDVKEIMCKCEKCFEQEGILGTRIDGMGLVNVYARLRLMFHDDMVYHLVSGKGRVIIGRRSRTDDSV